MQRLSCTQIPTQRDLRAVCCSCWALVADLCCIRGDIRAPANQRFLLSALKVFLSRPSTWPEGIPGGPCPLGWSESAIECPAACMGTPHAAHRSIHSFRFTPMRFQEDLTVSKPPAAIRGLICLRADSPQACGTMVRIVRHAGTPPRLGKTPARRFSHCLIVLLAGGLQSSQTGPECPNGDQSTTHVQHRAPSVGGRMRGPGRGGHHARQHHASQPRRRGSAARRLRSYLAMGPHGICTPLGWRMCSHTRGAVAIAWCSRDHHLTVAARCMPARIHASSRVLKPMRILATGQCAGPLAHAATPEAPNAHRGSCSAPHRRHGVPLGGATKVQFNAGRGPSRQARTSRPGDRVNPSNCAPHAHTSRVRSRARSARTAETPFGSKVPVCE